MKVSFSFLLLDAISMANTASKLHMPYYESNYEEAINILEAVRPQPYEGRSSQGMQCLHLYWNPREQNKD